MVNQPGNREQVGRGSGVDHERVLLALERGELCFESQHLGTHCESVGGDHSLDGVQLRLTPG